MNGDVLWPDGVGARPALILPLLPLLHEVRSTHELHTQSVAVVLGVLDRCGEVLGLTNEVGLVCTAAILARFRASFTDERLRRPLTRLEGGSISQQSQLQEAG